MSHKPDRSYDGAQELFSSPSITSSVLGYYKKHKFGTIKMCADYLRYDFQQIRGVISPLKERQQIRPQMVEGRQRGNGVYILSGYNQMEKDAAESRLYALKTSNERFLAGRSDRPQHNLQNSVSDADVSDENGAPEPISDPEDVYRDPDAAKIERQIKNLGIDKL